MSGKMAALVLAGKRDGAHDPLAAAHGVTHKCLVPVAGRPLIAHVLDALAEAPNVGRIFVSIDAPELLDDVASALIVAGRLQVVDARPNLVDSIAAGAEAAGFPLLVTTADNVLLTPAAVAGMHAAATARGCDAAVAFASQRAVLAAHPDGQRRFYRFRDDAYSNCNLYWLANRRALDAAEAFRGGGQFAKHPARIVRAFGAINLLRFAWGLSSLEEIMAALSKRFGVGIAPVVMADGGLAIDVDNARTHSIAGELLLARSAVPLAAE